ncbi:alpha-1,2-fucosyltransferase [Candidatus Roizmanbacteria bacterium]|nr:MAG: alpha-1,2-fucosyltransferase [Candidatus Roizmanbacteria bacterium]
MIIANLTGGLGNQMFQYAFGRATAERNKTTLKLHFTNALLNTPREFELDLFNITGSIATEDDLNAMRIIQNPALNRILYLLDERFGIQFNRHIITEQFPYNYSEQYRQIPDNRYLQGYWSHTMYFEHIRDILFQEFTPKKPLDEKNKKIVEQMRKTNSISLHVRRGDYITNKTGPRFVGIEYYKNTIDDMNSKVKAATYFVFSDDIAWCQKNLSPLLPNVVFIDHNTGRDSYKDLILMSNCKHNITANSTFSWWGAWLNPNKNKIIISPNP